MRIAKIIFFGKILCFLMFCNSYAQTIDENNFEESIKNELTKKYLFVSTLENGFARVENKNHKEGFVNKEGVEVVPVIYDAVRPFSQGLAQVKKNNLWGFINTEGKEVIPFKYTRTEKFKGNTTVAQNKKGIFVIDQQGKIKYTIKDQLPNFLTVFDDEYIYFENGFYGIKDFEGKIIEQPIYDRYYISNKNVLFLERHQKNYIYNIRINKRSTVAFDKVRTWRDDNKIFVENAGKSGVVSDTFQIIVPIEFDYVRNNDDNTIFDGRKGEKSVFFDENGKVISECTLRDSIFLENGLIRIVTIDDFEGVLSKTGKLIIPLQYEFISLKNDRIIAEKKNKKGYDVFTIEGKKIKTFNANHLSFQDGIYMISQGSKWTVFNTDFSLVSSEKFEDVKIFNKNLIGVKSKTTWKLINAQGKTINTTLYEDLLQNKIGFLVAKKEGKWGLLDYEGKNIQPFIFDKVEYGNKKHVPVKKDDKYSFVNSKGELQSDFIFDHAPRFDRYKGWLSSFSSDQKYGVVDTLANTLISNSYDKRVKIIEPNEFYKVEKEGLQGIVGKKETEIIPTIYKKVSYFRDQGKYFFVVKNREGKYGIYSSEGTLILKPEYGPIHTYQNAYQGIIVVRKERKEFLFDLHKEKISGGPYDYVTMIAGKKIFSIKNDDKYTLFDAVRMKELSSVKYNYIGEFLFDITPAVKNGKGGFIDEKGKEVIPFIYDKVSNFSKGIASVKKEGKYGYIDKENNVVIPIIFDRIKHYPSKHDNGSIITVIKDQKYGLYDVSGKEIVAPKYQFISRFNEGYATFKENDKYGVFDFTGKIVLPPKYYSLNNFHEGLAVYAQNAYTYGYINSKGEEVIPAKFNYAKDFKNGQAEVKLKGKKVMIDTEGVPLNNDGIEIEEVEIEEETID